MTASLLHDKAVLLIGASTGIGREAARVFADEGARLVLAARSGAALDEIAEELRSADREVRVVVGDVTSAGDVARMVDETVAAFGRLDGAFNNAGLGQVGLLHEVTEEDFDHVMAVNVKGMWLCLREELRVMRAQGFGAIVNTSSVGGAKGSSGLGVYQATKHAVNGLTRSAAHDNGPLGIRVNAVAPGPTRSAMIDAMLAADPQAMDRRLAAMPLGKIGTGAEVANAAAWLLSDRASHTTGAVLPVEGGMTA
ncbi:SDR family NAD(P)-dependent oxidoreductase [Microbacterium sp. 1.5R]|uniref:SDR family NAD(P)-dependent oxidoreductase n=1 Tax=Microbacterium sp. 1.5R TaxID=1916917 RepID=UPI0011A928D0|nr:SDR family NAD(P)-dependent oxidoreductase [Microbacterium sp. 1.5R]